MFTAVLYFIMFHLHMWLFSTSLLVLLMLRNLWLACILFFLLQM